MGVRFHRAKLPLSTGVLWKTPAGAEDGGGDPRQQARSCAGKRAILDYGGFLRRPERGVQGKARRGLFATDSDYSIRFI